MDVYSVDMLRQLCAECLEKLDVSRREQYVVATAKHSTHSREAVMCGWCEKRVQGKEKVSAIEKSRNEEFSYSLCKGDG